MTGPEQQANTVERLAEEIADSAAILYGNTDIRFSGSKSARRELKAALEELVALAERAATLKRELGEALEQSDYHEASSQRTLERAVAAETLAEQARAEADRLREERDSARAAGRELAEERNQAMRITGIAREALERIAGQDCERFTDADPRECVETKREPCDRCVALAAIITLEAAALAGPQARAEADRLRAVVDAARVVSETERTGVLPDFQPLAGALADLAGPQTKEQT